MYRILAAIGLCFITATASAAGLTAAQKAVLQTALAGNPPGSITIACPDSSCKAVETDVIAAFKAAKWAVTAINHGGLGISGIVGLRVEYCGIAPSTIINTLGKMKIAGTVWPLAPIDVENDGICPKSGHYIYLVIGDDLAQ